MRQAVILVGGRGTRLGSLASAIPKPLLPISGERAFLDYLIADIARHGVTDVLLLAGHLAPAVIERYQGKHFRQASVRVIAEPSPAGTAGALRHAAAVLDETFLLTNGDSFFDFNYLALEAVLGANDIGALALRHVDDGARFGSVDIDAAGRILGFREKDTQSRGGALISAGAYLLRRSVLDLIQATPCSLEHDVFPRLASSGRLASVRGNGDFIDIGLPETLHEARTDFASRTLRGAVFFDRDGTLTIDDAGYTHRAEDLRWQPGAIEAVRAVNDAGRLAIVVTNQSGVARGLYDEQAVHAFHTAMQTALRAHGAHIDAFYYCPYHSDGAVEKYSKSNHPDRKPNAGMLRRAMLEWPIDPRRSLLVGDSVHDVAAAQRLGIAASHVQPGALLETINRAPTAPPPSTSIEDALRLRAIQARAWLFDKALPLWWDIGFDRASACFHEKIALNGAPAHAVRRMRVQARQTYVFAQAGQLGWQGPWREAVQAGADVLLSRGLSEQGAPRHALDANGRPDDNRADLYDLAFILFGLASAYATLKAPHLLQKADQIIAWLEQNWSASNGGYREGAIVATPPRRQNPHMHAFEAFMALYDASGDAKYRDCAAALADLFKTKLFNTEYGALTEYFDETWSPALSDEGRIAEPGHAFEWSWLLTRWDKLNRTSACERYAEQLRIHAEVYGVDYQTNAVFDEIWIDGSSRQKSSRLWPHTERLKANLARFESVRDQAAGEAALQAFDKLQSYLDVETPGLWRDRLDENGAFIEEPAPASSFYHLTCAYSELIRVCGALT